MNGNVELKVDGIKLSDMDRERVLPFVPLLHLYCPGCNRLLATELKLQDGIIRVRGCGECGPGYWYKLRVGEGPFPWIQLAERDW